MHPRLTASNGRVAHLSLRGKVKAERFSEGKRCSVVVPVAGLLRAPGKGLDCQLLFGENFNVLEDDPASGYAFGFAEKDGYAGYVKSSALGEPQTPSHKISALSSHIYSAPDIKSRAIMPLPFGASLTVRGFDGDFAILQGQGFVPKYHVAGQDDFVADFVAVAARFMGVPYLWGGNTAHGIDCSGLVQVALHAAGKVCPRDSDMQQSLGSDIGRDNALERGDLVFWQGHVGVMRDSSTLIHANAHWMAVTSEPLSDVKARVKSAGGGSVQAVRRI